MQAVWMAEALALGRLLMMAADGRLGVCLIEAVKVISQALNGMHTRILDGALRDFGYGGKRHAAALGDLTLCCRPGKQARHDEFVQCRWLIHGTAL